MSAPVRLLVVGDAPDPKMVDAAMLAVCAPDQKRPTVEQYVSQALAAALAAAPALGVEDLKAHAPQIVWWSTGGPPQIGCACGWKPEREVVLTGEPYVGHLLASLAARKEG